jgi:hypothetical protein
MWLGVQPSQRGASSRPTTLSAIRKWFWGWLATQNGEKEKKALRGGQTYPTQTLISKLHRSPLTQRVEKVSNLLPTDVTAFMLLRVIWPTMVL